MGLEQATQHNTYCMELHKPTYSMRLLLRGDIVNRTKYCS